VLGGGSGSYGEYWFQHRRVPATVHDAHNLYLETLAELGPIGLALLALALAVPLAAVRRARSSPLAAAAVGAYVAYLAHAFIDWDWEMPAVTLTALACGLALLTLARGQSPARTLRPKVRMTALGGTAVLVAFVLLGLLGNSAISASSKSADAGHLARAESQARRAMNFAPWSAEPWRRLGEAQVQHWSQRLTAGHDFRGAFGLSQHDKRGRQVPRTFIAERRGLHAAGLSASRAAKTASTTR